jgi:hypothetical protein
LQDPIAGFAMNVREKTDTTGILLTIHGSRSTAIAVRPWGTMGLRHKPSKELFPFAAAVLRP